MRVLIRVTVATSQVPLPVEKREKSGCTGKARRHHHHLRHRSSRAPPLHGPPTEADLAGLAGLHPHRAGCLHYAGPFEFGTSTSFTVPEPPVATTCSFSVTALDKAGNESTKSREFSKSVY
jgi:hypothetical protein